MKTAPLKDLSWVTVQLVLLTAPLVAPAIGKLTFLGPLRPLGLGVCGAGLAVSGLATWQLHAGRSLTPLPSPRAEASLLTSGFYRHVRHPVYTGLLIWALGLAIAAASLLHFLLFALLWAFLTAKAAHEEHLLGQKFSGYADYAARTPRFFPFSLLTRPS
jgi:protein-S-isoprenylcysteine O-methyltransferase Ste14